MRRLATTLTASLLLAGCGPKPSEPTAPSPAASPTTTRQDDSPRSLFQQPCTVGGATVTIGSVQIGKALVISGGGEKKLTAGEHLGLVVVIKAQDSTKELSYRQWQLHGEGVRIQDSHGQSYPLSDLGPDRLCASSALPFWNGKSAASDMIVFPPPHAKAEYLDLDLPAENVGGSKGDVFRFRIYPRKDKATSDENLKPKR